MGLDVYLRWYDDPEKALRLEKKWGNESDEIWRDDSLSKEQREAEHAILAESFGFRRDDDDWGYCYSEQKEIKIDSTLHPDHLFKVGYFRSSYNEGGINSTLKNFVGKRGLYWIFPEGSSESYHVKPDWKSAIVRVDKLIQEIKGRVERDGEYDVSQVSFLPRNLSGDKAINSSEKALQVFMEQKKKNEGSSFPNYSNGDGLFLLEADEDGKDRIFRAAICGSSPYNETPAVYVVLESLGHYDWYIQALEIVKETCEYVLAQENPDQFRLCWSG